MGSKRLDVKLRQALRRSGKHREADEIRNRLINKWGVGEVSDVDGGTILISKYGFTRDFYPEDK